MSRVVRTAAWSLPYSHREAHSDCWQIATAGDDPQQTNGWLDGQSV